MIIHSYTYTDRTLEELATRIFKMTIRHLIQIDCIDHDKAEEILKTHAVMVRDPLFFRRYWDRITKKEEKGVKKAEVSRLFIVKLVDQYLEDNGEKEKDDGKEICST